MGCAGPAMQLPRSSADNLLEYVVKSGSPSSNGPRSPAKHRNFPTSGRFNLRPCQHERISRAPLFPVTIDLETLLPPLSIVHVAYLTDCGCKVEFNSPHGRRVQQILSITDSAPPFCWTRSRRSYRRRYAAIENRCVAKRSDIAVKKNSRAKGD